MAFEPRSLQQRTLFFILLPTFLLLITLSVGGFWFVRNILLHQWGEVAVVELRGMAHLIDMELHRPKEMLRMLQNTEPSDGKRRLFNTILRQIDNVEGVVGVNVEWPGTDVKGELSKNEVSLPPMGMMRHKYRLERFEIGSPKFNNELNNRTVSLISEFKGSGDKIVGRVEVLISFDTLIEQILDAPWWKSNKAYLIDNEGNVLANTAHELELEDYFPMRAFGTVSDLEKETLAAMGQGNSGTVFGAGSPPEEVSGFYRLKEAPWTMVVIAKGEEVLQPIIQFRFIYVLTLAGCILVILIFIRLATNRITTRIEAVSAAADDLASGIFGPPLPTTARDEVGELAKSFNKMSWQLKQRLTMKKEINIAREVQQNLLPQESFEAKGIVAGGVSIYCDETGGDYFDIITFPENDRKVGVAVGDVVGHGIGAALLMTTVRALLRGRLFISGSLAEIINDVNHLLYQDTSVSGNFVTLFYLEVDRLKDCIRWVRGGHEPAMVYYPASGKFHELKGKGVALGVDEQYRYEYNELPVTDEEQLILLGSDGAWEVANSKGEQFGKERIRQILAQKSDFPPSEVLRAILDNIATFRGDTPQSDDITLVVVKTY